MSESTATRPEAAPEPEAAVQSEDTTEPATATSPETAGVPESAASDRRRRVLRAIGRWTAAVTVFGVLGTGVAYGITERERTDLPGLATKQDGRWDYPELVLPPLPSGAPRPFAEGNIGEIHHADARDLLLPAPAGATAAKDLPSLDGEWVSVERFAEVFVKGDRTEIEQRLHDDAVRHIAARGWSMPDGTRTEIYLLQFNSAAYPGDFYLDIVSTGGLASRVTVTGSQEATYDDGWPDGTLIPNVLLHPFDEAKPRGETHVRSAYLTVGDTLAVIVQARKGTAHAVPFQQTVILQSQLLG